MSYQKAAQPRFVLGAIRSNRSKLGFAFCCDKTSCRLNLRARSNKTLYRSLFGADNQRYNRSFISLKPTLTTPLMRHYRICPAEA